MDGKLVIKLAVNIRVKQIGSLEITGNFIEVDSAMNFPINEKQKKS